MRKPHDRGRADAQAGRWPLRASGRIVRACTSASTATAIPTGSSGEAIPSRRVSCAPATLQRDDDRPAVSGGDAERSARGAPALYAGTQFDPRVAAAILKLEGGSVSDRREWLDFLGSPPARAPRRPRGAARSPETESCPAAREGSCDGRRRHSRRDPDKKARRARSSSPARVDPGRSSRRAHRPTPSSTDPSSIRSGASAVRAPPRRGRPLPRRR